MAAGRVERPNRGDAESQSPNIDRISASPRFIGQFLARVFGPQKFTVTLNLAKRGLRTLVGRSQVAPLEATS